MIFTTSVFKPSTSFLLSWLTLLYIYLCQWANSFHNFHISGCSHFFLLREVPYFFLNQEEKLRLCKLANIGGKKVQQCFEPVSSIPSSLGVPYFSVHTCVSIGHYLENPYSVLDCSSVRGTTMKGVVLVSRSLQASDLSRFFPTFLEKISSGTDWVQKKREKY